MGSDRRDTHDLMTYLSGSPEWDIYQKKYMELCARARDDKLKPVQFHKKYVPDYYYTGVFFNGEFRFWTWKFGLLHVFVSNTKGICIEMEIDPFHWWEPAEVLEEFNEYYEKILKWRARENVSRKQ